MDVFTGIQVKNCRKTFRIILEDETFLDCTEDHKLMTLMGFIELSRLCEGDVIETVDGYKKIVNILSNSDIEDVYDILDAGKDKAYYTNEILS